jgi:protocatechuate 3,4-dioxygenase beta subunit
MSATDVHRHGLAFDLAVLVQRQRSWLPRRRMIQLLAGIPLLAAVGCAEESGSAGETSSSAASSTSGKAAGSTGSPSECSEIPEETAGPYPGDGSNGPNALTESGIVRPDITRSVGSGGGTAKGVPLTITLTVLDGSSNCAALKGAAVYVWHCTQDGGYSLYSQGVTDENFLRGVQETDASGRATFQSIFPGAYSGRWPHIHFEVFPSLAKASTAQDRIATSQIALPEDACSLVYQTRGYNGSVRNFARTSLTRDNVFGDDSAARQLGTVSGDVKSGMAVELPVTVMA